MCVFTVVFSSLPAGVSMSIAAQCGGSRPPGHSMASSPMALRASVLATIVFAVLWRHAACAGKNPKGNDLNSTYVEPGYTIVDNKVNDSDCKVLPADHNLNKRIKALQSGNAKLVVYEITLEGYDVNPLLENVTRHFHADVWHRTFSSHGRTLLTLAFNYDIVSLLMLSFGVEHMDVTLKDEPKGCMGDLEEEDKITVLMDLLTADFLTDGSKVMVGEEPHVCEEVRASFKVLSLPPLTYTW